MASTNSALALDSDDTTRRGVLFDVDGTLCDTNYFHAVCWSKALWETERILVPMTTIHRHIGMGSDKLTTTLIGRHSDAATEMHTTLYRNYWSDVRAFAGVPELLREISDRNLEVVLASSADSEEFSMLEKAIGAQDVISAVTNSGDVQASKPDPDIFGVALERAGLSPDRAMVVGDTVWDIEGARRAGLSCIGLLSGGISARELIEAGALEVWDDPQALLDNLDDSALGRLWNAE